MKFEDLFLMELQQVSDVLWQPVLAFCDPGDTPTQEPQADTPPDRLKVPPHGLVMGNPSNGSQRTCHSESSPTLEH